ncbi:MAG: PIG-L deacetylase family protein [Ignavibacteriales bacterium]
MAVLCVVGAHAMDAELMGGAIALELRSKGWQTYLVHMTRGERGHPAKEPSEYGRQLEKEMRESARKLDSECLWMGYEAGAIPEHRAHEDLAALFDRLGADAVITHWKGSYHPRHVETHFHVMNAVSNLNSASRVKAVYFGENMEDLEGFSPTLYFDVSGSYSRWMEALGCYELFRERVNQYPYREFYSVNSVARGIEAGVQYAKCLMSPPLVVGDLPVNGKMCRPRY